MVRFEVFIDEEIVHETASRRYLDVIVGDSHYDVFAVKEVQYLFICPEEQRQNLLLITIIHVFAYLLVVNLQIFIAHPIAVGLNDAQCESFKQT